MDDPIQENAGIAVLRGNLCEDGAVIKPSAATPALMTHSGRAVVFEDIDDYHARIDDPDLDVDASCVLVLKQVAGVTVHLFDTIPDTSIEQGEAATKSSTSSAALQSELKEEYNFVSSDDGSSSDDESYGITLLPQPKIFQYMSRNFILKFVI